MDKLKGAAPILAAILIGGLFVRIAFPSTRTRTIRLPSNTDTVTVTETELQTLTDTVVKWRETVTTDTVLLTETIHETDTVRIAVLPGRWYLDSLQAPAELGETAVFSLTYLEADSAGLARSDRLERQVALGPIREVQTDSAGLHVEYGEFPEPGCEFGCQVERVLLGVGLGVLGWELVR